MDPGDCGLERLKACLKCFRFNLRVTYTNEKNDSFGLFSRYVECGINYATNNDEKSSRW